MKLTDPDGMEGPTTATFGATDGLGRPIQISATTLTSCDTSHQPPQAAAEPLPVKMGPHTFSGGICMHCGAGWGSPEHAAAPNECPELAVAGSAELDPDFEQEGIDYWMATVPAAEQ